MISFFNNYRVFLVTGAFGSGKTEFAINLAVYLAQAQSASKSAVQLVDLDIVNMYFRSRQRTEQLQQEYGIKLISSAEGLQNADIPALSVGFSAAMRSGTTIVLDIGGDTVGATATARFRPLFQSMSEHCLLMHVFNPYRPYADGISKIQSLMQEISEIVGLPNGLLIANPNLGLSTDADCINSALPFIEQVQSELQLPMLLTKSDQVKFSHPKWEVFSLRRFMKLPFEKGALASI